MPEDSSAFSIPSVFTWTEEITAGDSIQKAAEIIAPTAQTEPLELVPETTVTPESQESDELAGLSEASKFARSYQETDKLFPEDFEIPNDLDWESLKKLIWAQTSKNVPEEYKVDVDQLKLERENKLREKGLAEDQIERVLQYSEHLANGGSEEVVSRSMNLDILANSEPVTDEDKETIIKVQLSLEGNSPEAVEALIEKKYSTQEALDEGARIAQIKIAAIRDKELQLDAARALAEKQAIATSKQAERQQLEDAIEKGFGGIILSTKEKEDLKKFMFTADQVRDMNTPQGRNRIVETEETKKLRELAASPEKRAELAYWLKYGMEGLVNAASKTNMDKFMASLGKKQNQVPTHQETETRRVEQSGRSRDYYTTFPITG